MKKALCFALSVLTAMSPVLFGQDTASDGKALNIPFRKYGLSFGNSQEFNGLRFNYADRYVKRINGINVTLWSAFKTAYNPDAVINGLSIGTIVNARKVRPLGIFILGAAGCETVSGLSLAGIGIAAGHLNGVSVCGIMSGGERINGVTIAGLFSNTSVATNGVNFAGLGLMSEGDINGVAAAVAGIYGKETIRGLALTAGYLQAGVTRGFTFAGYARIDEVHGLSIAILNRTKELHGMQLGLINIAGNNRKGLKVLPVVNFHL